MAIRNRRLILEEMLNRARGDFANIVLMRQWNASFGGVFVEKRPGMVSNPYLEHPDITDTAGKVYTKKNPSLMTRELSELLQKDLGYAFHITSLKTDASCLACHAKQGYRIGDIRGGISVSFDVQELEGKLRGKLRANLLAIIGLALVTITLLVGSLLVLFRQMMARLQVARDQLVALASTDALTGLMNRRSILQRIEEEMERHRRSGEILGCILLDIDLFKQVNDRLGHAAGDEVLRQVARHLRDTLRPYDAVGRFGGEEFLVILPGTDRETLRGVAGRLRAGLPEQVQTGPAHSLQPVTASFGITTYRPGEVSDAFLARADHGMYKAKSLGRNRVEEDET